MRFLDFVRILCFPEMNDAHEHILLMDGNNIGYRSMYEPEFMGLYHQDLPIGGIVGIVQSVLRFSRIYPQALPVALWDGHAQWRTDIWPAYKTCRTSDIQKQYLIEQWQQQSRMAQALLLYMGVPQIMAEDAEAQDLAHWLCRNIETYDKHEAGDDAPDKIQSRNHRITLISHHTLWMQALSPSVDCHIPTQDTAVNLSMLLSGHAPGLYGLRFDHPQTFLLAKAIAGDVSKHIPGVSGVGIKTAAHLLQQYKSIQGILQAVITGTAQDRKSQGIMQNIAIVYRNLALMDWKQAPEPRLTRMLWEPFDRKACVDVCLDLGIAAIIPQIAESQWTDCSREWSITSGNVFIKS